MNAEDPASTAEDGALAAARARVAVLTAELEAARAVPIRLRNLLATLRSVFRRTAESAETLDELRLHFTGRFDALSRCAAAVPIELEDIVRDELLSVGTSDGEHVEIAGPPVVLEGQAATLVGLAVHELAANAVKFGALTTRGAGLSVTWTLDGAVLHLRWHERDVPVVVAAPIRFGFGREFIEQGLPYQLKAETRFDLRPGGIVCDIALPLSP